MKSVAIRFVLSYLRLLAKLSLSINKPRTIGIAGTAGKSSTRNALYALLKDHFRVKTVYGNSETGVPLGILGVSVSGYGVFAWVQMLLSAPFGIFYLRGTEFLIAEMGIDEPDPPKNMEYLLTILKPEIAIYLNESSVHTMQFEKLLRGKVIDEDKKLDYLVTKLAEEDAKIITKSGCKVAIYNADDKYVKEQVEKFKPKEYQKVLSFGSAKQSNAVYKSHEVSLKGTEFNIIVNNEEFSLNFKNQILPEAYQENFAAAILVGLELGLQKEQIENSITKNLNLPPGRSSIFDGINESVIIDSSYNASKMATFTFLDLLEKLKSKTKHPIVIVFGDMREIGSAEDSEHIEVGKRIITIADNLYLVGTVTRRTILPIAEKSNQVKEIRWFENSEKLGEYLSKNLPKYSILLVKGSQNTIFLEEAIKPILKSKSDGKKLCRQEDYWLHKKHEYFRTTSQ